MLRTATSKFWGSILTIGTLVGCQTAQREPYLADPLLRERKPVLGTAETAFKGTRTRSEPLAPAAPIVIEPEIPGTRVTLQLPTHPQPTYRPAAAPISPYGMAYRTPATGTFAPFTTNLPLTHLAEPALHPQLEPVLQAPSSSMAPSRPQASSSPMISSASQASSSERSRASSPVTESASAASAPTVTAPQASQHLPIITETVETDPRTVIPATAQTTAHGSEGMGYAPDHSWLQGRLDRHYRGHYELRYCDPRMDEKWGGKVILPEDARLHQFREGDWLRVEGELVPPSSASHEGGIGSYPTYRIRSIRKIDPPTAP